MDSAHRSSWSLTTSQTTSSSSGHVHQAGSNTQIPDWHHDLLDFFAIPAAALHAEGLKGFYASGSGGDASSNLWVVGRASSDGKDVLPPKPAPKKRPVRPAHSQDESGVEFVHEVIQVDPAPEAPRQESPTPAYEVQLATPRAPGDLIASLLSTDADDKAFSGSDQTEMGPPQGKKTKHAARTKFGRSIAGSMRKKAVPKTVLTESKRRKTEPDGQEHSRTLQQEEYANYNIPPHLLDHSQRPSGVSVWFIPDEDTSASSARRSFADSDSCASMRAWLLLSLRFFKSALSSSAAQFPIITPRCSFQTVACAGPHYLFHATLQQQGRHLQNALSTEIRPALFSRSRNQFLCCPGRHFCKHLSRWGSRLRAALRSGRRRRRHHISLFRYRRAPRALRLYRRMLKHVSQFQ